MTTVVPRRKRATPVPEGDSITLSIRMPGGIYNDLSRIADAEDRNLNAQIVRALREWVSDSKMNDANDRGEVSDE